MNVYTQLQAADAMRDAANNQSGGAGLTAGIGAGMGIGNLMGQALTGNASTAAAAANNAAAKPAGIPDVMTPAEAAGILRVSEEDVVAAITAGDLKAKKLGNAYRISKESLEAFLKS
jgi:excisionase family DNA binding protein